jgi:hypothetical protein
VTAKGWVKQRTGRADDYPEKLAVLTRLLHRLVAKGLIVEC